ncbi:gamma-glutamyltransferase [Micromonospora sp. STR1s_5]|nr:gamma-glutamyltransferase [Micromonospora sp. STR1s_5]
MSEIARIREMVAVSGPKVISAAHPAAAAAGLSAYAAGGNAFDAALAACFMETVALPMKAGLFGDLVALFRVAGGEFQSIISIGAGPKALSGGATLEPTGPRSVGVPGAPHGYAALHGMARLDLERLVAPAVSASERGVPWTRVALSYVQEAAALLAKHSPENPYSPGGHIPALSEVRRLPGLGRWLRLFASRREALFEGEDGAHVLNVLRARGGILDEVDFRQRPANIGALLEEEITADCVLSVTGRPTQGFRLAKVVRAGLRAESLPEIVRADRDAAKRKGQLATDGGTSVVTAADDEGNAVVVLHSNSFPQFASGIVLDDGLILNNRPGRGFDLEAPSNAADAPRAGRVPPTTLHAWCLKRDDTSLIGATPGGVNQLPWNAQTILELMAGRSIAEVVTSPRWALDGRDMLTAETGARTGDAVPTGGVIPALSLRSAQQVIRLARDGLHEAAADPRAGCVALAAF